MKFLYLIVAVCAALARPVPALADCMQDRSGNVVCGGGQCETDRSGQIYCAEPGGGAVKDVYGNVLCGVGYCARDITGQIWCSKRPGGGAANDVHGKVKCLGGCDAGSARLCEEAQY